MTIRLLKFIQEEGRHPGYNPGGISGAPVFLMSNEIDPGGYAGSFLKLRHSVSCLRLTLGIFYQMA